MKLKASNTREIKIENLNVAMGMMFVLLSADEIPRQSFELVADSEDVDVSRRAKKLRRESLWWWKRDN